MTRARAICAALVMLCGFPAHPGYAASNDVTRYVERRKACNHWLGEEGYDAARRAEINQHIASLGCMALDKEEQRLLHRYRRHPGIVGRIRAAHDALL